MTRAERLVALLAPFAAAVAVASGLRLGAPQGEAAAIVYGAPVAAAATAAAWQVFAFRDQDGSRSPMAATRLSIVSRRGDGTSEWSGDTNADGIAEAQLAFPGAPVHLEVAAGTAILARGDAVTPDRGQPARPYSAWAPFARRNGRLALDVAVLGQRVAPGFPSMIGVRVTDAATGAPVAGVRIRADDDPSVVPSGASATTDSSGWTALTVTPVGLALSLTLRAQKPGRATHPPGQSDESTWAGEWIGGLYASPGAARLETRARWSPEETPEIELVAPTARTLEYLEIDDARGRVWATSVPLANAAGALPSAVIRLPRLLPGLYWAVAAGDPRGASELGPGTSVRPFFVASSDEVALSLGLDPTACPPRVPAEQQARALWPCLCVAAARPIARWVALDGSTLQRARAGSRRTRGVTIAVGALTLAGLLELMLLLRAAASWRSRVVPGFEPGGGGAHALAFGLTVGAALLVALLGFALLALFVERAG
ncbi:MAG TPA: carboxypeptidase-like regulatory domain-containing protein [Polyangiaceae bacterium]|nr:carboxypeptidase-like regulatory domain-containing protein [Polyangiaceae bacterium]